MTIVYRSVKGSGLTNDEIDDNFEYVEPLAATKGDAYTVVDADSNNTLIVDPAGGSFTINLTAAATLTASFRVTIINIGSTGTVTIDPNAAETINGAATVVLSVQYETVTLQCTGTTWYAIAEDNPDAVTASAVITDNTIVRGDGGARGVQETGITVADTTNDVSGMGTLSCGAITSTGVVTSTGFTIGSAVIDETDLEKIDDITNGTAAADKAVVLDASTNISGIGTVGCGAITSTGASSFGSLSLTTDLAVADGGSGRSSHTAYAVICGGTGATTAQQSIAGVGTSGQVLTSNGAGALPTFQAAASSTAGTPYVLNPYTVSTASTTAHGLGAVPDYYKVEFECLVIDGGWQVGDVLSLGNLLHETGLTNTSAIAIGGDATNTYVATGSGVLQFVAKTAGAAFNVTAANWKLTVTPYII